MLTSFPRSPFICTPSPSVPSSSSQSITLRYHTRRGQRAKSPSPLQFPSASFTSDTHPQLPQLSHAPRQAHSDKFIDFIFAAFTIDLNLPCPFRLSCSLESTHRPSSSQSHPLSLLPPQTQVDGTYSCCFTTTQASTYQECRTQCLAPHSSFFSRP